MRRYRHGRFGDLTRWLTGQSILIPSGLGNKPIQRLVVLYYRMYTYRGTLGNIFFLLISVAGILSSFVRYKYLSIVNTSPLGAAVYTTIWVTVLISSVNCSYLYLRLLSSCGNIYELWMYAINHVQVPMLGLFVAVVGNSIAGTYAVSVLRMDMLVVAERVETMEMHSLWKAIFSLLYYSRILQRILECLFMTLVFPVAKLWADTTPIYTRGCTVQLLPWRTFHLFQRCLLFMTLILSQEDYRSSWHHLMWVGTQMYIALGMGWLSLLAMYSSTGSGSTWLIFAKQTVTPSEERGSHRVISGKSLPKVVYSERSPLIVSGPFQRFQGMIHPEKQSRKKERKATISEKLEEPEESLLERVRQLENEVAEAVLTPWTTDLPAQQQRIEEERDRHLVFQEAVEEACPPPTQESHKKDKQADSTEQQASDEQPSVSQVSPAQDTPADLMESDLKPRSEKQLSIPEDSPEQLPSGFADSDPQELNKVHSVLDDDSTTIQT